MEYILNVYKYSIMNSIIKTSFEYALANSVTLLRSCMCTIKNLLCKCLILKSITKTSYYFNDKFITPKLKNYNSHLVFRLILSNYSFLEMDIIIFLFLEHVCYNHMKFQHLIHLEDERHFFP